MTTEMLSSKLGQGHYISFTTHWVNLLAAGKNAGQGTLLEQMVLPHVLSNGDSEVTSTPSSSLALLSKIRNQQSPPSAPQQMKHARLKAAILCYRLNA